MRTSTYVAALAASASGALGRPTAEAPGRGPAIDEATAGTISDYIEEAIENYNGEGGERGPWSGRPGRPSGGPGNWPTQNGTSNSNPPEADSCMSREDAIHVASTFQSIIQGYTIEQALAALTPDFVDYSSAVSIIINRGGSAPEDVTQPIFTSREEFMAGHGKQEPIPFETLKVWSNCEGVVSMVWRSIRSGQGQENESAAIPVTGTAILETEPTSMSTGEEYERAVAGGYNYRINTLWSEFNTVAWLVNNGVVELEPEVETTPIPEGETTPSPPSTITKREPVVSSPRTTKRKAATSKFDVGMA